MYLELKVCFRCSLRTDTSLRNVADKSKKEYKNLLLDNGFLKAAKDFSISDRVDGCSKQHFKNDSVFHKSLKLILILSHGNGRVEGGFSINESIILNGMGMKEHTVIAQRTVHDWILHSGKRLSRDLVYKRMMDAINGCRQRYEKALKTDQKNQTQKEAVRAEKRKVMSELSDLQKKRQTIGQKVKGDKEKDKAGFGN